MPLSRSDSTLRACVLLSKVRVCAGRPVRRIFTRQNWPRFSMVATLLNGVSPGCATGTVPELSQKALKATIQKTTAIQETS
jgi:hypothetical protein